MEPALTGLSASWTRLAALRRFQWPLVYLAGYVVLDWASYVHPVSPLGITPWNPPAGLSLYFLLRAGVRWWPAVLAAAFVADVVVRGAPAQLAVLLASAGMIAAVYAVAAALLARLLSPGATLESPRDLAAFVGVAAPATALVAAGFVALYTLLDAVPRADFTANFLRYWIGDLNGILVLAPALLAHSGAGAWRRVPDRAVLIEGALQAAALAAGLWAVFAMAHTYEFRFFSLLFLPLVWVAARWGLRGATLALVGIQVGLIVAVQLARYHSATFIQLQFLMIALCITALVLGAVVTQRQRIETQLREKQEALNHALQLAAAGEMTSALAHELNQPIAALGRYLGACEVLARDPAQTPLLRETMAKAAAEAGRAAEVVRRLHDFYRSGAVRIAHVAPGSLVQAAVRAVQPRADRAGIRIAVRVGGALPQVAVDALQTETVLQNVLHNAIDALTAVDAAGRGIEVTARVGPDSVAVAVQDTGPGIAPPVAHRLFEPFTTTKPDGMGMGLAISRSLIRASGGEIALAPGGTGARFVVTLPRAPDASGT